MIARRGAASRQESLSIVRTRSFPCLHRFASTSALVLAALLMPLPTALASGNLLTNPSFEQDLQGWTTWGTSGCTHQVILGGPGLLKAYRLADSSSSVSCGAYQAIAVTPGLHYHGEIAVTVASGSAQLYLRWVDGSGNDVTSSFPVNTSTGAGTQVLATHGDAPSGATHVRFWLYCTTGSTCDVTADDANLEQE